MTIRSIFSTIIMAFAVAFTTGPALSDSHHLDLMTKLGNGEYEIAGAEKIDSEQAFQLQQEGAAFVDVRRESSFKLAHIPDAINLDVNSMLTQESLGEHVAKDQKVVFYCSDKTCYRSARASAMALTWGYTDVWYYAEGWAFWSAKGYPRN